MANGKGLVILAVAIIVLLIVSGSLKSFLQNPLPIPNAVYPQSNIAGTPAFINAGYQQFGGGCPNGKFTLNCMNGGASYTSFINNTYVYSSVTLWQGYCIPGEGICGNGQYPSIVESPSFNIYIASNLTAAKWANSQNFASINGLLPTQASALSNWNNLKNQNSNENNAQFAALYYLSDINTSISTLQAANAYNNALPIPSCNYGPFNTTSDACPVPACPNGSKFNLTLQKCTTLLTCPTGYVNNANGICTSSTTTSMSTTTVQGVTSSTTSVPVNTTCTGCNVFTQPNIIQQIITAIQQLITGILKAL